MQDDRTILLARPNLITQRITVSINRSFMITSLVNREEKPKSADEHGRLWRLSQLRNLG